MVPFKGTVRFASISCHRNREMGPKDDCESWFYLLIDMINPSGLPWKRYTEREDVLKCKEELRVENERRFATFFNGIPIKDFVDKCLKYIDGQGYSDKMDYQFIYDNLKFTATESKVNLDGPYDWEDRGSTRKQSTKSTVKGSTMKSV